jgi:Uma2 family endonuclease
MTTAVLQELAEDPRVLYRMSTDEYHRMISSGAVMEGAPYELLDGHILRKIRSASGEDTMTVNPAHATAVKRLEKLDGRLTRLGCHMRAQQPITLPPYDEPEPDGAIVRGSFERYRTRHPLARDVLCVIEVADASLGRDRGYKQSLYANFGIGLYLIVNLADAVIEVNTRPLRGKGRYGQTTTLRPRQSVTLPTAAGKGLKVPVRQLLP